MSKERELLRKILKNTQYMNYECNNKIRNEIMEFLAQPEQETMAWVWNPTKCIWEQVIVFGHWQQGAIYAFGDTMPETCVCQERQFKINEKCRELEIEVGRQEARMEVRGRSLSNNSQGIAQMAHMCSDDEYAAFRKRLGLDE